MSSVLLKSSNSFPTLKLKPHLLNLVYHLLVQLHLVPLSPDPLNHRSLLPVLQTQQIPGMVESLHINTLYLQNHATCSLLLSP